MRNTTKTNLNFRLDLIAMILMILLFVIDLANAQQSTLQNGIDIFNQKNYYGAKRFFSDYAEKHPDNAEAYYYLGRIAMEEGELKKATEYFDEAVEIDATRSDYFTWKGIAYVQLLSTVDFMTQGLYAPKALNALETAVELDPNNVEARMWLAGYYSQAPVFAGGSEEKTREQYETIIRLDPSYEEVYLNYGIALLGFEDYGLALDQFEEALEHDPDNYMAYFFIGKVSAESENFCTQGELALKKFIDLAPEEFQEFMAEAWWYLGKIYWKEGEEKSAHNALEKAVSLDPDNEEYQKSLKKIM